MNEVILLNASDKAFLNASTNRILGLLDKAEARVQNMERIEAEFHAMIQSMFQPEEVPV